MMMFKHKVSDRPPAGHRWLRVIGALALTLVIVVSGLLVYLIARAMPDPVPAYPARKGTLVSVEELKRTVAGDMLITELRLESSSGLAVEIGVRMPRAAKTPLPLVILAAGLRTGHRAIYVTETWQNLVVVALSYPFPGDPRAKSLSAYAAWLPNAQTAVLDTAPAVMLAMDYLAQQPYIDMKRVELVGGSLGAFLVSVPAALDERFRRVWLVHGAGDPRAVFDHLLRRYIGFDPLRGLAAQGLASILATDHLRPEKWVGRIAPRPIIVVNARDDESIAPAAVAALHQAVPEGTEIIWMVGPHVRTGRIAVLEELITLIVERVLNDPPPAPNK